MLLPNKLKLFRDISTKVIQTDIKYLRQLSSRTETLQPVKLSYATYEDTKVDESELAPPLVVVHGLFGSKSNWSSMCKAYQQKLLPKRKVVAIDCRNHGDSPHTDSHTYAHLAADIKELVAQLDVAKVSLIGHSMGGRAVMLFALKYPELVEKLIVADISPVTTSPTFDTMISIFAALENVHLPENVSPSQARSSVDKQLANAIPNKDIRAFLLTNLVQKDDKKFKWRINIPVLLANFNNIARFPSTNNLRYSGPTLFLAGELSNYLKESDMPAIREMFPKANLEVIEGSGHWVHSEKPHEFLSITVDFLNDMYF